MWTPDDDEFYIGYAPPMPLRLSRFVTRLVVGAGCALAVWAMAVAAGHVRLAGGTFEFGHAQPFSGTISTHPYPTLTLDGAVQTRDRTVLLVAPGKHGADALVNGLDGRHITLTGTRIHRGSNMMLEIEPESVASDAQSSHAQSVESAALVERSSQGPIELTGEIVDSKCFLGVMVPGEGKTHKDCAALCLRGGIPAALHVQDRAGHSALLVLVGQNGEPIGAAAVQLAGEPVSMTGTVHQQNAWLVLRTDPTSWHSPR
jgi:hypothetical protein